MEDEKMFQIGVWSMGLVLLLTVCLQVCYRTQNRALNRVRRDIIQTQQEYAVAQANFAAYVRPEILRDLVSRTSPKAEVVSFNKAVSIIELKDKEI
jgi:hypothetical protein